MAEVEAEPVLPITTVGADAGVAGVVVAAPSKGQVRCATSRIYMPSYDGILNASNSPDLNIIEPS